MAQRKGEDREEYLRRKRVVSRRYYYDKLIHNPEYRQKRAQYAKAWYQRTKERDRIKRFLAYKLWIKENQEHVRRYHRYRQRLPHIRAQKIEWQRRYRCTHRDEVRKQSKLRGKRNVRELSNGYIRYLLRKQAPDSSFTPEMVRNYRVILISHRLITKGVVLCQ
jgi:hypothetical protein